MAFTVKLQEFSSPERFHIELHFSPGAYTSCDTDVMNPLSSGYRTYFLYRQVGYYCVYLAIRMELSILKILE